MYILEKYLSWKWIGRGREIFKGKTSYYKVQARYQGYRRKQHCGHLFTQHSGVSY